VAGPTGPTGATGSSVTGPAGPTGATGTSITGPTGPTGAQGGENEYTRLAPENAILPASNGAYKQQQDGTNFPYWELAFDKDSDEYAYWRMPVPSNVAAGNWVIKIQWIADAATSGTGLFSCKYLFVADAEAWDDTLTNVDGAAVTTDGTAGNVNTSTITITTPTANAGETLILAIYRDVSGDTLAEDAKLVMGYVDYPV